MKFMLTSAHILGERQRQTDGQTERQAETETEMEREPLLLSHQEFLGLIRSTSKG